ncbi:MAG TPA: acyltransferase [Stellaceae bacterium]|nr:acyltransferase [Stellaceae bacterium]
MDRHNNFDALRLLAATAVIFSHAFLLATGRQDTEPLMVLTGGQTILGVVGVFVFFVISGYLVTQSWEHTPSLPRFALKRALRIYPGLAACILVLTFGLGPIISSLPLSYYLSSYGTYDFLVANLLLHTDHNSLPGVWFTSRELGHILDGPLWSLPVEIAMYVMVAALGASRLLRVPVLVALLAVGMLAIALDASNWRDWDFTGSVLWLLGFFVIGMLLQKLAPRRGLDGRVALLALAGLIVSVPLHSFILLFPLCGGYLVIYLALNPSLPVIPAARFGDLSYGLYIYGWPVEQTVLYLRPDASWWELFLIAFPATAVVAFLSWHVVERRALRLKPAALGAATRPAPAPA